jgi:hypothetical protein
MVEIKTDIGNDIFAHLRRGHSYYVDKSLFIKEFFESKGHINLIARPRRFGKSLNLTMLKSTLRSERIQPCLKGLPLNQRGRFMTPILASIQCSI